MARLFEVSEGVPARSGPLATGWLLGVGRTSARRQRDDPS